MASETFSENGQETHCEENVLPVPSSAFPPPPPPRPPHPPILIRCWEIKDGLRSGTSAPGCLVPPTSHCQPAGRQPPAPSQPDPPFQGRGNYTWGPHTSYFGILCLLRGLPGSPRRENGQPQKRVSNTSREVRTSRTRARWSRFLRTPVSNLRGDCSQPGLNPSNDGLSVAVMSA